MKKTLRFLLSISFLSFLIVPQFALAVDVPQPADSCTMDREINVGDITCADGEDIDVGGEKAICCLLNTLYNVVDWVFVILVGVSGIMVIIGALQILTAAGVPEKVTSGRNYILYAAIGLLVALLAKAVPGIVKLIAGL